MTSPVTDDPTRQPTGRPATARPVTDGPVAQDSSAQDSGNNNACGDISKMKACAKSKECRWDDTGKVCVDATATTADAEEAYTASFVTKTNIKYHEIYQIFDTLSEQIIGFLCHKER